MRKQATQIIPGDSVRVADINLVEGDPETMGTYAKAQRVHRSGNKVIIDFKGNAWGRLFLHETVRVHRSSNRAANLVSPINDRS
jgi:hypothetical protein